MRNERIVPFHLRGYLSKIQNQADEWVELIAKRWDDILEDVTILSVLIPERKEERKRI